jgi:hypothetical protein
VQLLNRTSFESYHCEVFDDLINYFNCGFDCLSDFRLAQREIWPYPNFGGVLPLIQCNALYAARTHCKTHQVSLLVGIFHSTSNEILFPAIALLCHVV